jgi:nitroimidazol reductase NimA-like FMN-containing flavoprotein (pyridoxamine 5'-phosphate oxidase superfamily)
MTEVDESGLEILEPDECIRLLEPGGIGRLAWVEASRPAIRPVNFALDGNRVVIRTGEGRIHAAAQKRVQASLEVDGLRNVDHTAWSVIVDGDLASAADSRVEQLPLRPWAPGPRDHFVQVSIISIGGRRIGPAR